MSIIKYNICKGHYLSETQQMCKGHVDITYIDDEKSDHKYSIDLFIKECSDFTDIDKSQIIKYETLFHNGFINRAKVIYSNIMSMYTRIYDVFKPYLGDNYTKDMCDLSNIDNCCKIYTKVKELYKLYPNDVNITNVYIMFWCCFNISKDRKKKQKLNNNTTDEIEAILNYEAKADLINVINEFYINRDNEDYIYIFFEKNIKYLYKDLRIYLNKDIFIRLFNKIQIRVKTVDTHPLYAIEYHNLTNDIIVMYNQLTQCDMSHNLGDMLFIVNPKNNIETLTRIDPSLPIYNFIMYVYGCGYVTKEDPSVKVLDNTYKQQKINILFIDIVNDTKKNSPVLVYSNIQFNIKTIILNEMTVKQYEETLFDIVSSYIYITYSDVKHLISTLEQYAIVIQKSNVICIKSLIKRRYPDIYINQFTEVLIKNLYLTDQNYNLVRKMINADYIETYIAKLKNIITTNIIRQDDIYNENYEYNLFFMFLYIVYIDDYFFSYSSSGNKLTTLIPNDDFVYTFKYTSRCMMLPNPTNYYLNITQNMTMLNKTHVMDIILIKLENLEFRLDTSNVSKTLDIFELDSFANNKFIQSNPNILGICNGIIIYKKCKDLMSFEDSIVCDNALVYFNSNDFILYHVKNNIIFYYGIKMHIMLNTPITYNNFINHHEINI